jgi:outer membrane protein OmpA-like peptidoglycan-associated protein
MKAQIILIIVIISLQLSAFAEEPVTTKALTSSNVEFKKANFRGEEDSYARAITEFNLGDKYFEIGNWLYVDALKHYLNAWEFNPNNAELNYKIGVSYLETYNKTDAVFFLERALLLDPLVQDDLHYLLGLAYHYDHNFDAAINSYYNFLENAPQNTVNLMYDQVQKNIREATFAKKMVANPVNVKIYSLDENINSSYPDYCPVITPDGDYMVFTARRSYTKGKGRDARDFKYNEDIFEARRVDGVWQPATNTNIVFNDVSHDATVGISADGTKMLIYKGDKGGDIWESIRLNGVWQEPYKLNNNINSRWQETSASYSPDGNMMYFVSDRPGGMGGKDIYVSELQDNGLWGKAKNLGSNVNTVFDEEAVFIAADGKTMYFSSKGHQTMGGYDIFKSELIDGSWTSPVNMGYPINTADDDIFFVIDAEGKFGYFSSERADGYGSQDIYTVEFIIEELKRQIVLNARVIDELYKLPLEIAFMNVIDKETGEIVARFEHNGSEDHLFNMKLTEGKTYIIEASSPGFEYGVDEFYVEFPESGYEVVEKDIELTYLNLNSLLLPIVYFDFDKYDLREEAISDIKKVISIMNRFPQAQLEIIGHTDIIGSWDYNWWLSRKRSFIVANYIINSGIEKDRLELVWYSFDLPAAENKSDEGRQLNRRTEFRLIQK